MRMLDADALAEAMGVKRLMIQSWEPDSAWGVPIVDAEPVVRCKDCDMWNEEDFSGKKSLGNYRCACAEWSNTEDGRRVYTGPDEFCSRGERREEDNDER